MFLRRLQLPLYQGFRFVFSHPAHFIAFGFGAGLSPVAPGTAGTLLGFPLFWLIASYYTAWEMLALIAVLFAIGVPEPGWYHEVLNSDAAMYGGSNMGNGGGMPTEPRAIHGHEQSLSLTVPPLGFVLLKR